MFLKIVRIVLVFFMLQIIFGLVFFGPILDYSESNQQALTQSIIYLIVLFFIFGGVQLFMNKQNPDTPMNTLEKTYKPFVKYAVITAIAGVICLVILVLLALGDFR